MRAYVALNDSKEPLSEAVTTIELMRRLGVEIIVDVTGSKEAKTLARMCRIRGVDVKLAQHVRGELVVA